MQEQHEVVLNASGSLYADNQASFSWKQIGENPTVEIKNSGSPVATFDAPVVSQFIDGEKSITLTFQLTVVGAGNLESTSITTVKVNALNTPPVAESQSVTTKEDTSVSITLDAADKDGDGLTYSLRSSPSHGSLSSFNEDTGSVVYNPDNGYTGSDSFTFTASDGTSTSNTGKVSITVNSLAPEAPINTPPVAESQSVTTKEDTSVSITLDAADKDGDGLTYSLRSSPSHGSLSSFNEDTGSVVYNPDNGYTGSDSFTFTASDGTSTSNTGKVSITVNSLAPEAPINTPPVPERPVAPPEAPINTSTGS